MSFSNELMQSAHATQPAIQYGLHTWLALDQRSRDCASHVALRQAHVLRRHRLIIFDERSPAHVQIGDSQGVLPKLQAQDVRVDWSVTANRLAGGVKIAERRQIILQQRDLTFVGQLVRRLSRRIVEAFYRWQQQEKSLNGSEARELTYAEILGRVILG